MPRIYYGWFAVTGCFLCSFSYGIFYTLSVFFTTLEAEFGWSATLVSSIHSVHLLVFIFSTFFIGWLTDRFGPQLPILVSAFAYGIGLSLLSRVMTIGQFYTFYIIASLGAGVIFSLPTAIAQRWFAKGTGLALGIVVAGTGLGIFLYAPLAHFLISNYGWRLAYLFIGIGTALSLFIASLIVTTPEKKGIKPFGGEINTKGDQPEENEIQAWDFQDAIRTKTFIMIATIQFLTVLPIHMIATHLVRFAELSGIEKAVASAVWGLTGGISIVGRIVVPALADRKIGWIKSLSICTFICGLMFLWLLGVNKIWMLTIFVIIYGFFYGGKIPLIPGALCFFFGTMTLGQLSGLSHAISLIGGTIGPVMAGYIVDTFGSYKLAFIIGAMLWFTSAVMATFTRPPQRNPGVGAAGREIKIKE